MSKRTIRDIVLFAMFGAIMFCSKLLLEFLPNIHMLGMLTMLFTLVYRWRALIPIYVYVMLNGLYAGFNVWWLPYLYIWAILWGVTMLLPRRMPVWAQMIVYPVICSLHGLAFGTLYAPAQAIMFGYDLNAMLMWIASGFVFDCIHAAGNLAFGLLIVPGVRLLRTLEKRTSFSTPVGDGRAAEKKF